MELLGCSAAEKGRRVWCTALTAANNFVAELVAHGTAVVVQLVPGPLGLPAFFYRAGSPTKALG